jgi:heat shock protein HtpX
VKPLFSYMRTLLLLAALTGLFVALGRLVAGDAGMVIAFVVALGMNLYALFRSRDMVLRMHQAREVTSGPLYDMTAELARRAELPMPKVFIMDSPQPNAFATGASPSSAAVCASTGLLDLLTPEEVAGVMAHELAHIKNRDTLTMTVAATFGGAISMLAQFLQFGALFGRRPDGNVGFAGTIAAAILAPLAATLIQTAVSRSREYEADRVGARIAGNPLWLASALEKIQEAVRRGIEAPTAEAHRGTSHMFIVNPLTGDNILSTHPSTENRVAALRELAQEMAAEARQRGAQDGESAAPHQTAPHQRWQDGPLTPITRRGRPSITRAGAPWLRR